MIYRIANIPTFLASALIFIYSLAAFVAAIREYYREPEDVWLASLSTIFTLAIGTLAYFNARIGPKSTRSSRKILLAANAFVVILLGLLMWLGSDDPGFWIPGLLLFIGPVTMVIGLLLNRVDSQP